MAVKNLEENLKEIVVESEIKKASSIPIFTIFMFKIYLKNLFLKYLSSTEAEYLVNYT
jgi:hypothetical protein